MMSTTASNRLLPVTFLLGLGLVLGCSGLTSAPEAPQQDTNPPDWQDTAARKAAKIEANRPKRAKVVTPAGPTEGPLTVSLPGQSTFTAAEVQCTSGFRRRCMLASGRCVVAAVPTSDTAGCEVFFQGATRASYGPVHGGSSLSCTVNGAAASCRVSGE